MICKCSKQTVVLLALILLSACGASVQSWQRPDYAAVDQGRLKHLALRIQLAPAPEDPGSSRLWTLLVRRYVNQHSNFIIKPVATLPASATASDLCQGQEGILDLAVQTLPRDGQLQVTLQGRLVRCGDEVLVWKGEVSGCWAKDESTVAELRAHYVQELGKGIEGLVAPAFLAIKAWVPTLPKPVLTDADELEKIEIGD